jgi:hypothetical protein
MVLAVYPKPSYKEAIQVGLFEARQLMKKLGLKPRYPK